MFRRTRIAGKPGTRFIDRVVRALGSALIVVILDIIGVLVILSSKTNTKL